MSLLFFFFFSLRLVFFFECFLCSFASLLWIFECCLDYSRMIVCLCLGGGNKVFLIVYRNQGNRSFIDYLHLFKNC